MKQSTAPQSQGDPPSGETWLSVGLPILFFVVLGAVVVAAVYYKNQRWRKFVTEHECQMVGKMSGDVAPTVGFDMKGSPTVGVVVESDKVGWKCNNGITYWR